MTVNVEEQLAAQRAKVERWARTQLETCGQYLQENSLISSDATAKAGWLMPGRYFIGKVTSKQNPDIAFWVILGPEGMADHIECRLAVTARDAARHFVLRWQLHGVQADTIDSNGNGDVVAPTGVDWQARGEGLAGMAEELAAFTKQDPLWPPTAAQ